MHRQTVSEKEGKLTFMLPGMMVGTQQKRGPFQTMNNVQRANKRLRNEREGGQHRPMSLGLMGLRSTFTKI